MDILSYLAVGALVVIAGLLACLVGTVRGLNLIACWWTALAETHLGPDVVAAAKKSPPPDEPLVGLVWVLIFGVLVVLLVGGWLALGVWYALGWLRAAP